MNAAEFFAYRVLELMIGEWGSIHTDDYDKIYAILEEAYRNWLKHATSRHVTVGIENATYIEKTFGVTEEHETDLSNFMEQALEETDVI